MAQLFISYKRQNQDFAFAIQQWLVEEQGWAIDDIFVDLDNLRAGDEWAKKLFAEAEIAQAMLFLASDEALHQDSFCYRELRQARGPVLAVTLGGVLPEDSRLRRALPYEALARQVTALDQQPTEDFEFTSPSDGKKGAVAINRNQLESIGATLRDLGIAPNSFEWTPRDVGPYPGLAPLQEGDEAIFFGRDIEIRNSIRSLEEMQESVSEKVYLIQAPSGAGKSSFLRAGLWKRLRNHAAFTPLGIVRPSQGIMSHPEWGLISQLSDQRSNFLDLSKDSIKNRILDDLVGYLKELAEKDAGTLGRRTLLLGIDQAEEISTLEREELREFELLMTKLLSAESNLDIRLLMTVRDDSVDRTLKRLWSLALAPEAIRSVRLHRLPRQRYREIIRGPAEAAERVGWPLKIDSELEISLAESAGSDNSSFGDALPLLAIALQRMVLRHRTPSGYITLAPIDVSDFLEAAVADTVKEALEVAGESLESLKLLFIPNLATWDQNAGEGGAAKRLVASDKDLFLGKRVKFRPLADALVDLRLLTRTNDQNAEYYEVAHEALLRVSPLRDILYELREEYALANILRAEALAWVQSNKSNDHLARTGERLGEAQALIDTPNFGPELTKPETNISIYLAACAEHAEMEDARHEKLMEEELVLLQERAKAAATMQKASQSVAKRTRIGLIVVSVLLLFASMAGLIAYQSGIKAKIHLEEAQITASKLLASFAQQEIARQDYGNAIALALSGLPSNLETQPLTYEPLQVLYDSIHDLKELRVLRGHEGSVTSALELNDGRILTSSSDKTTRFWTADGQGDLVLQAGGGFSFGFWGGVIALSDGRILTWSSEQASKIWAADGSEKSVLSGKVKGALGLTDGRILTWNHENAQIRGPNGRITTVLDGHLRSVTGGLELSDGRILTMDAGGLAQIWQATGGVPIEMRGHENWVWGALELTDGRIITWSTDGTARLWDADGRAGPVLTGHDEFVNGALELTDGRILTWGNDDTARLWNADGSAGPVLRGHEGDVHGALELADGRILTWSDGKTTRIWNADGSVGPVLRGHEDSVNGALELIGGRILTWSDDMTSRLWNADGSDGSVLRGHEGEVRGTLELSNSRILTWSTDGTARLWNVDGDDRSTLRGHDGRVRGALELTDGRILTWDRGRTGRLWSADSGGMSAMFGYEGEVLGALKLRDGRILTWDADGAAKLWAANGSDGPSLLGHKRRVSGAVELADRRILTWGRDNSARLWTADGSAGAVLRGHEDDINGALELADRRVLTWSDDTTARLWAFDGSAGPILRGHDGKINGALELADGRILTWSDDSTARFWAADGSAGPFLHNRNQDGYKEFRGAQEFTDGRILIWDDLGRSYFVDANTTDVTNGPSVRGVLKLADGRMLTWDRGGFSRGSALTLWSVNGSQGPRLLGHRGIVLGALELADGRILSWDSKGTTRQWGADGGEGFILRGHDSSVLGALEHSSGLIVIWSRDGTARLWPGTRKQLVSWGQDVIVNIGPLSQNTLCNLNLSTEADCP